ALSSACFGACPEPPFADEIMSPAARPLAPADRRFLTGLIGAPIAHSASPAMHERAAEALGAHCHYQLIEVAGAGPRNCGCCWTARGVLDLPASTSPSPTRR